MAAPALIRPWLVIHIQDHKKCQNTGATASDASYRFFGGPAPAPLSAKRGVGCKQKWYPLHDGGLAITTYSVRMVLRYGLVGLECETQ